MLRLIATLILALGLTSAANAALRVTMSEAIKAAIAKPQPEFSAIARQMKVSGKVEVEITIAEDGSVDDAQAISGNPLLTTSALAAVKKWKFNPFQEGGAATKATVLLSFDFRQ